LIAARERAQPYYAAPQAKAPVTRPVRERQARLYLTALLVTAFALAVACSYVNALAVTVGYQADALRSEIARLDTEKQNLQAAVDRLDSLPRMEALAVARLGMVRPTPDNVMFVAVGAGGPAAAPTGGPAVVQEYAAADGGGREVEDRKSGPESGMLQAFLDLISR